MHFEHDLVAGEVPQSGDGSADGLHSESPTIEADKEFVMRTIAELEAAGLAIVYRSSDTINRLYLSSGEIFRLGDSEVTRLC
jgi:hypothetical protein